MIKISKHINFLSNSFKDNLNIKLPDTENSALPSMRRKLIFFLGKIPNLNSEDFTKTY